MYTPVLTEILRTGKVFTMDESFSDDIRVGVNSIEGAAIYGLIKDQKISRSLEVGCAYGISSLFICDALSTHNSPRHTIIDPIQSTRWRGIGISNLRRAGFDFFSLIEKGSEIALPELLANSEKFQFIFIDGWHTFDHTLLDFFYANRLLEDGGFIAIDDTNWPSIRKVVSYVTKYPNYRVYARVRSPVSTGFGMRRLAKQILWTFAPRLLPGRMVIFQKTGPDMRSYDWYERF